MQLTDFIPGGNISTGMASAFTTLTAGEALSAGDVTVQASDGKAYYAIDPSGPYSALRPIAQATASYNVAALPATTLTTTNSTNSTTFALSNGNVGIVYAQSANLYFTAIGPDGTVAVPQTLLVSDYSSKAAAISLSGGGFALAYIGTNTYVRFAVFSNTGAVVSAAATVTATAASAVPSQLCQMSGGNIVVYYQTSSACGFAIYTPAGAVAVAPTAGPVSQGVIAPCGTGFVFGWATSQTAAKASVYSSTGALLGSVQSTTSLNGGAGSNAIAIPLSNGNAAVVLYSGGNPGVVTSMVGVIVSPAGASVANNIQCFQGSGMPIAQIAATADGGFIAFMCSTILMAQRVSASGALVGGVIQMDNSVTMTSASLIRAAMLPDGGMTVAYTTGAGGGAIKLARLTSAFALAAAPITTLVSSDNPVIVAAPISLTPPPYTSIFLIAGAIGGTGVMFGVFSTVVQACQPVGVTKASIPAGSTVSVQVLGAIATRLTFAAPYSIDARTSTPPGQRMSVVGALAILNGIQ